MDIPEAVKKQKKSSLQKIDATTTSTINALHAHGDSNSQAGSHTHGPNCNHGHASDSHL